MSANVTKIFSLSSPLKNDEMNGIEKQGIITILGFDFQSSKVAAAASSSSSLRKTLSADMSSNNWVAENGFNPIKKIASFAELDLHDERDEDVKGKGQDEIWASIQLRKDNDLSGKTWGSIIEEDKEGSPNLSPPYIHPLVKRTVSSLSEKSLLICTESLGTETGSDVFEATQQHQQKGSFFEEVHENKDSDTPQQQPKDSNPFEEVHVVKYNYSCSKKFVTKSFPPPLSSLAQQDGASSLQMQSHRQNGRLVLEAVSIPTKNCFHAQREHGRLLLTLVDDSLSYDDDRIEETEDDEEEEIQEFDQVFDGINDEDKEDEEGFEEEENEEFKIDQSIKIPNGIITMPKGAFMMNKYMGLHNNNLTWSSKLINNANVKLVEVDMEEGVVLKNKLTSLPQSLTPSSRVTRLISSSMPSTTDSLNAYQYFWKEKPTMTSIITPIYNDYNSTHMKNNRNKVIMKSNTMGYEQQNLVLIKGDKGDYLVPFLSRCTEPRRSLLFWESSCIATS